MKRIVTSLATVIAATSGMMAAINIDGTEYACDTLQRRQIGPGIVNTIMRLPDYPLNVYILETDLNNQYNRVETTISYGHVGTTELLTNAFKRNRTATKRPLAACNANFWCVTGHGAPFTSYMMGSPFGAVVRNDSIFLNTNTLSGTDKWNGGPKRTGATAISKDKTLYFGHLTWAGVVKSPKLSTDLDIATVNRRALTNQMVLWNGAYTKTREFENDWTGYNEKGNNESDNYYLALKPGSSWQVNQDMTFIIKKIVKGADRQKLGDYDACLTPTGTFKTYMAPLAEGDEIVISQGWTTADGKAEKPLIENMVEGNATLMMNGELTQRNYDETYNSQVYSRTAYGASADGKHLYMIVIDNSVSKLYGRSAGCPTAVMCQILKSVCPDVSTVVNYDAGGSAEMMVDGKIINTTTEGNPRAVACGWMLETVAPEDNEIASIAFDDFRISMPVYSSFTPKVLGYNKYGDLVSTDVQGFSLSTDATVGQTDGQTVIAGGNITTGTLTANYNGIKATVSINTMAAQPAIAVKPIVVDNRYIDMPVNATVGNRTYTYDPSRLGWTVDNKDVATIENGKLHGVANGQTRIECQIGDMTDVDTVTVEISDTPYKYAEWTGWTTKGSGAKNITLNENGLVKFTYASARAPYLTLQKPTTFYSLPDTVALQFESSIALDYLQIDVRNSLFTSQNYMKYTNDDKGFEAGKTYTVKVDLEKMGGTDNLATYPLTLREIKFTPNKSAAKGEQTLNLKALYCHYNLEATGVDATVAEAARPSVAVTGGMIHVNGASSVAIYNVAGALVSTDSSASVAPGIYVVVANGYAIKVLVK